MMGHIRCALESLGWGRNISKFNILVSTQPRDFTVFEYIFTNLILLGTNFFTSHYIGIRIGDTIKSTRTTDLQITRFLINVKEKQW